MENLRSRALQAAGFKLDPICKNQSVNFIAQEPTLSPKIVSAYTQALNAFSVVECILYTTTNGKINCVCSNGEENFFFALPTPQL